MRSVDGTGGRGRQFFDPARLEYLREPPRAPKLTCAEILEARDATPTSPRRLHRTASIGAFRAKSVKLSIGTVLMTPRSASAKGTRR
jgi:hypothetical protein